MRKILFFALALFCISVLSCTKELKTISSGVQTTMNQNLKTDNTGVTLSSAQDFAIKFLKAKSPNENIFVKSAETITKNGVPYFHVINANKGFVIVSSDSLYVPIIGYDTITNFSYQQKDLNPGLITLLNKHARQLEQVRTIKNSYFDSVRISNKVLWTAMGIELDPTVLKNQSFTNINSKSTELIEPNVTAPVLISSTPYSSTVNSTIGPLCLTAWDQVYPWNQYCPSSSSLNGTNYAGHDPAGCVEIAMAQIMYFWNFPSSYNWTAMVKAIGSDPSTQPATNPGGFTGSAQLISDIGTTPGTFWTTVLHSFQTGTFAYYQPGGTASDDEYAASVFNHFGYSSATTSQSTASQITSGPDNGTYYETLIRNEIQNNRRPCMVGGYNSENNEVLFYLPAGDGHDWVCDGSNYTTHTTGTLNTYKSFSGVITTQLINITVSYTSWLHMNWGWGTGFSPSVNTAWYNALTDYSAAPNGEDFKYFQIITYNIHP
jgi:Peptidase C10 family/Spi protease inhibitor